jgi:hypothetical protein
VRCPWHHACFNLRTGEALADPALTAASCWRVERRDGRIFVREKVAEAAHRMPAKPRPTAGLPERIVIIGGGAAGYTAAEMLRRKGFAGRVTLVSADEPQRGFTSTFTKFWLVGARGKMSGPESPPIGGLGEASWAFEVMLVVVPAVVVPSIVPDAVGAV